MGLKLKIAGVQPESVVDGPGVRYAIFTQGCPHHCRGCHNPQTHDFAGGIEVDVEDLFAEICEDPLLAGVTFSGGEPFCQPAPLTALAKQVHALGKNVIVYSGYTLEELLDIGKQNMDVRSLLLAADTLIDGRYVEAERDLTLAFRGSRNQRVIDVKTYFAEHPMHD